MCSPMHASQAPVGSRTTKCMVCILDICLLHWQPGVKSRLIGSAKTSFEFPKAL